MIRGAFLVLIAFALTVGPAIWHGKISNRWGAPPDLSLAGEQVLEFPRVLGNWKNEVDERSLSEAVCRELGLLEHFHRRYFDAVSGAQVEVLLMVGPPGPLVRHPPEICYANRANQQLGDASLLEVANGANKHNFKMLGFTRIAEPLPGNFHVAYGYADNDARWSTPSSPRVAFGGGSVLFKLQVLSEDSEEASREHIASFLRQFVSVFSAATPIDPANGNRLQRVSHKEDQQP